MDVCDGQTAVLNGSIISRDIPTGSDELTDSVLDYVRSKVYENRHN